VRHTAVGVCSVLIPVALLWIWYNEARWGVMTDIGYIAWYHQDSAGMPTGSPFRLAYLPYQLWSFFVQRPAFSRASPWIIPSLSGVALTWTSPAVAYGLCARRPALFVTAMWAATLLVAVPSLVYYVNGYAQFGMRHTLDFMPFLFALMVLAARQRLAPWSKVLIAYSIAVWAYGVWYWNVFVRP